MLHPVLIRLRVHGVTLPANGQPERFAQLAARDHRLTPVKTRGPHARDLALLSVPQNLVDSSK